jgi:uncharacterized membrane protein YqhA
LPPAVQELRRRAVIRAGPATDSSPRIGRIVQKSPAMLHRLLASSRYLVLVAIFTTFLGSIALLLYETFVVVQAVASVVREGPVSAKSAKDLAVGLIEAVDIILIAITVYIISVGLYALFIDDTLKLPRWLGVQDFEDLKHNLVSAVIAVLAVLFLREAVAWEGERDILHFGAALAVMIVALTFYLLKKRWTKSGKSGDPEQ